LNSPAEIITENPLFAQLPQSTLENLKHNAIHRTYQAREIIVHHGDVWPNLFLVAEGEIHAVKESLEGRALIATTLGPGDIFWGLAFFIDEAPMPVMLQANSPALIYLWTRDRLVPIIKSNGEMSWHLCQLMIKRMQVASEIVEELAFHPVMSRLAGFLLDISGKTEDEYIARDFTLDEMAARIGTTREMVCRHLYRFAEMGAIEINRTEFKIKDRWFLEKQAKK
jgi:CRP/FNR family transcriptional regulator